MPHCRVGSTLQALGLAGRTLVLTLHVLFAKTELAGQYAQQRLTAGAELFKSDSAKSDRAMWAIASRVQQSLGAGPRHSLSAGRTWWQRHRKVFTSSLTCKAQRVSCLLCQRCQQQSTAGPHAAWQMPTIA